MRGYIASTVQRELTDTRAWLQPSANTTIVKVRITPTPPPTTK